jgi:hypothetical protein
VPLCARCVAGRTPIPPPLRSRFAAIEAQRAAEAALGERPLESVVAPVPVPQVRVLGAVKVVPVMDALPYVYVAQTASASGKGAVPVQLHGRPHYYFGHVRRPVNTTQTLEAAECMNRALTLGLLRACAPLHALLHSFPSLMQPAVVAHAHTTAFFACLPPCVHPTANR